MLSHFWEAEAGGYICKIIVQSKKGTALGVKNDRDDLFFKVVEYCNLAYESYKTHAEEVINGKLKATGWTVDFPFKGVHSLASEVYVLHQLEGELEPIQVDFTNYMEFNPFEEEG